MSRMPDYNVALNLILTEVVPPLPGRPYRFRVYSSRGAEQRQAEEREETGQAAEATAARRRVAAEASQTMSLESVIVLLAVCLLVPIYLRSVRLSRCTL